MSSTTSATPTRQQTGVLLVAISAVIWSTAGIFTKVVAADVWTILFWRGIFSTLFMGGYLFWRQGREVISDFARLGRPGWGVAVIGAAATVCFIASFKNTTVANVGVIYATVPFFAAALAWLLIRELPSRATLLAATAALIGVVVMVAGSLGTPNLVGDGLALLMTAGMAMVVVLIRKHPRSPMILANGMSLLLLIAAAPLFTNPLDVSLHDLVWLIGFGLVFTVALVLLTEGTRLIPASQSALIGTLETPLAPVWAWLVLSELPPALTWIGGAIVLAAVLWNIRQEQD